jgi:hypothetical protein
MNTTQLQKEVAVRGHLMPPPAAAAYLGGIVVGTLAKWRHFGGGPEYVRIGSRVFYENLRSTPTSHRGGAPRPVRQRDALSCSCRRFARERDRMIDAIRGANIGRAGIEADEHGELVGKDPRHVDQAEFRASGHMPMPVLKAIRAKCVDCYCGSPGEIRNCMVTSCRSGHIAWAAIPGAARKS